MKITQRHSWALTIEEAIAIQEKLRGEIITSDSFPQPVQYVAGVDMGFEAEGTISRAAVAVLSLPDLKLLEYAIARRPTSFPYVPGFLSFREIPAAAGRFPLPGILERTAFLGLFLSTSCP